MSSNGRCGATRRGVPGRIVAPLALCALVLALSRASAAPGSGPSAPVDGDYEFLVKYMPAKDRGKVGEEYLRANVALAQEARRTAPWRDSITDEIFREYVLPYSSVDEEVDDWRALFRRKFWPLVKDCRTTGEAVQVINSRIWGILGVKYDTRRDRPDQSPFHSMRIHMASCTGLAILEIDVYRACGIPARFVGCNWTTIRGNHSWVEYYDNGKWHFFNDAEEGRLAPPDKAWFTPYAAKADASSPRTRIYASRWSPGPAWFRLPWRSPLDPNRVPADDVTLSYRRFLDVAADPCLAFVARDPATGRRVPTSFRLVDPATGRMLAGGVTYDETHDANDHFKVSLPKGTAAKVQVRLPDGTYRDAGREAFGGVERVVELKW